MKITSRQKLLAAIALMVIAVIAAAVLLILPKLGELGLVESDRQTVLQQVEQSKTLLAQLEQAKSTAALTQAELLRLANQFPENPELPSVIIELQDVSNAAGLRFNSVTPGVPVSAASGQYSEIPLAVVLRGQWPDILDYLGRLDRMTRVIRVTDVALAPEASVSPTSTEVPYVLANVSMRAYVMTPSAAAAPTTP